MYCHHYNTVNARLRLTEYDYYVGNVTVIGQDYATEERPIGFVNKYEPKSHHALERQIATDRQTQVTYNIRSRIFLGSRRFTGDELLEEGNNATLSMAPQKHKDLA